VSAKPKVTGSRHILPFLELAPASFERLCLWLVRAEGFGDAEHYGSGGSDHGRDVVALKRVGDGTERWCFQCKRSRTVRSAELKWEIDKILSLDHERPAGVVFVVAGTVSARQRDAVRDHAAARDLACFFWARTELDALVKNHPTLLREFFLTGAESVEDPESALRQGLDAANDGDLHAAVRHAERAIAMSHDAGDAASERHARLVAARWIGEMLRLEDRSFARGGPRHRIAEHLAVAEKLGAKPVAIAVERAIAARLDNDPEELLDRARAAMKLARDAEDAAHSLDALIVFLQAALSLGLFDEAASFADDVAEHLRSSCSEAALVLLATWLMLRSRAGLGSENDADDLIRQARVALSEEAGHQEHALRAPRAALIVGEVAGDFHRSERRSQALALCLFGCELAEAVGSPSMFCNVAVQVAGVAAELGDEPTARAFLARAQAAVDEVRTLPPGADDGPGWETLHVSVLGTRGRALVRLSEEPCEPSAAEKTAREGVAALREAIKLAEETCSRLKGSVDDYVTDLRWWLARAVWRLGETAEASQLFHAVRTAPAMSNPSYAENIGMRAWHLEAESLLWLGRPEEASAIVVELLAVEGVPPLVTERARNLSGFLEHVVLPYRRWADGSEAERIATAARASGVRRAVATEFAPLVSWWREWQHNGAEYVPCSELLDFWGRGCFARIAAAVRAKPHAVIAVDARSVEEVRRWAWILCPLFDTVLVKWKGELVDALLLAPLRVDYGGPGGHGYVVYGGLDSRENWAASQSWANPLPREVASFLATEAIRLVAAGRLIVVPAPSVGCTQSGVGWTDELLLDGLLGGVVSVVSRKTTESGRTRRVLDLATHSLPYVADIDLKDLADVLDEIDEWVSPLRSLLFRSLTSDELRTEHWQGITALEGDIRAACAELQSRLRTLAQQRGWRVAQTSATVAAGAMSTEQPGSDAMTALLRAVVGDRRELAPWIPYWRLQGHGGHLDWSGPLDNPSRPSPEAPPTAHTWLYPGTAGWHMPIVVG